MLKKADRIFDTKLPDGTILAVRFVIIPGSAPDRRRILKWFRAALKNTMLPDIKQRLERADDKHMVGRLDNNR